ncbi:hypothetical protein HKD37_05G012548 [Glycine soja]
MKMIQGLQAPHGATSPSTLKWTRKATRLRSLATRPVGAERPVVLVNPVAKKADSPHKKKLRTYLGIVARDKVDVTYENWKQVLAAYKDLIWGDIQRWRQFKFDLTSKWALAADKDSVDDTVCEKYNISKEKWTQFCQSRRDHSWEAIQKQNIAPHLLSRGGYEFLENKLMEEKKKKQLEEAAKSGSTDIKLARTKENRQMTSEPAKEIANKIDSLEEQASQDSFVAHGRQDVLTVVIGRQNTLVVSWCHDLTILWTSSKDLSHVFIHGSKRPRTANIKNQGPAGGVDHRKSDSTTNYQFQSQMQSQGLALSSEPKVGPSAARVNTKESCVDPLGNDPDTGDSEKCRLYVKENPPHLVALGRLYKGSTIVHNMPLRHDQVKVVKLWQLIVLDKHGTVGPVKPTDRLDNDVDDPIYLMTLTIPQLFLMSLEVMWDATMFGVFNDNFPLYIKYEDLSEIAQMVNVSTSLLYSIKLRQVCEREMTMCMDSSSHSPHKGNVYLGNHNLNKKVILKTECKIQRGIALKELNHTPQSKSKAAARWIIVKCNRQKGSTEYGYYVMHWMSTIILGSFKNNWETYFNDVKPLEPERLKALRIHWAIYYLKDKNETISV